MARKAISFVLIFLTILVTPSGLRADHVVSPVELQQAVQDHAAARQNQIHTIRQFLSAEPAKGILQEMKVDPQKVVERVAFLSDEELSRLAVQTQQAQSKFAAGYHMDDLVTVLLVILVVVAVIVIVTQVAD